MKEGLRRWTENARANDLQLEWNKQSKRLAGRFAKKLRLTEEQYIAGLPKFASQPEQFKDRFDIPVIVETRLPLGIMLEIAGIDINTYLDVKGIEDWDKKRFVTPKVPYIAWLEDGMRNQEKSVKDVRINLASDERGGTPYDGLSLFLRDRNILKHHYLDFPGSKVGSDNAPFLFLWRNKPELDSNFVSLVRPRFGSVVAGKL